MEIFFCDGCGRRITDLDFQTGKAVEFEGQRFCAACGAKVGPGGPPGSAKGGRPPTARATPMRTTPSRLTPARSTPPRLTPRRTTPARLTPARTTPARTTPARGTGVRPASGSVARARIPSGVRPAVGASGSGLQDAIGTPRSITAMRRQRRESAAKPKPLMWLGVVLLVIVLIAALALLAQTGSEDSSRGVPPPSPDPSIGTEGPRPSPPGEGGEKRAAAALAEAGTQAELTPWLVKDVHEAYLAVTRDHANTEAARKAVRLAAEWKKKAAGPGFDAILDSADKYVGAHFAEETADALRGRVSFWAVCWRQSVFGGMAAADKVKPRHDAAIEALLALEVDVLLRITHLKTGWQSIEGGRISYFREGARSGRSLRCEATAGATLGARRVMALVDRNTLIRFQYKTVGLQSLEVRATSTTQGGIVLSVPVKDPKPGAWARAIVRLKDLCRPGDEKPSGRNNAFDEISIVGTKDPAVTESYLLLDEIFLEEGRK